MGQKLGGLWNRVQGKSKVRELCNEIFDECRDGDHLAFQNLHFATLLVYNAINRSFPSPHKDPPSKQNVESEIKALQGRKVETIDREQFHALISKWTEKDLRIYFVNKIALALLAAPAMAIITKNVAKEVPRIGHVVERIPAPALVPAYTVGFVALQDVGG